MCCQDAEINYRLGLETVTIFQFEVRLLWLACCNPVMSQQVSDDTKQAEWLGGQLGALPHKGSRTGPGNETRANRQRIATAAPGHEPQTGWEAAAQRRSWGLSMSQESALMAKETNSLVLICPKGAELHELVKC